VQTRQSDLSRHVTSLLSPTELSHTTRIPTRISMKDPMLIISLMNPTI
jgi:hypothetical protein